MTAHACLTCSPILLKDIQQQWTQNSAILRKFRFSDDEAMAPITYNKPQLSNSSSNSSGIAVISNLISNLQTKFERRNAVRYKVDLVQGHKFESIILKEPTICSQCSNLIWGLAGFNCKSCKLVCHRKCFDKISGRCRKELNDTSQPPPAKPDHKLEPTYFATPTACRHCGILIKGIFSRQGVECNPKEGGCGISLHYECVELVCHSCKKQDEPKVDANKPVAHIAQTSESSSNIINISPVSIEDFDLIRLLGKGSFSKVYLARFKQTQQEFAVKVLKKTNLVVYSDPSSVITEMRVLNLGRQYTFLAIAHCCFQSKDRLYFVMEYVVGHDLVYHIGKARKFPEDRARFYAAEIFLALRFLHNHAIVYRDLKLDNVILDEHGHCKLIDFGMSKELPSNGTTNTFCGTPSYISPETIKNQGYSYSVDWWAFGVLIFEMLVGYSPFEAEDEDELYKRIVTESVKVPLFLSDEARALLEGLLQKDPTKRLGCQLLEGCADAIMDHPFFLFRTPVGRLHQWREIETKQIPPPYKPKRNEFDDNSPTEQDCSLTPVDADQLKNISKDDFRGFSYCSESFRSNLNAPEEQ